MVVVGGEDAEKGGGIVSAEWMTSGQIEEKQALGNS
jgi:hypothetical protein